GALRRRAVSVQVRTKPAPPPRSTTAMCSGERKPSGTACSVVNETIWPTPRTLVGVIGTGCHGHHVAGGATTLSQRGQRDASMVSIICSGDRQPGSDRGWPVRDAPWLGSPLVLQ